MRAKCIFVPIHKNFKTLVAAKSSHIKYRLYHAVEVYTGMYKTAETGLETRARSARVSKVSKVLCIPVYTDTAWYKVFMPCRYTARARTRAMAPAA